MTDRRRYGVIEVRAHQRRNLSPHDQRGDVAKSNGRLAAGMVHPRRRRPMPDPCRTHRRTGPGRADSDQARQTMIVDGRMPTPEEAQQQLRERQERERLGEPWVPLEDRARLAALKKDEA